MIQIDINIVVPDGWQVKCRCTRIHVTTEKPCVCME